MGPRVREGSSWYPEWSILCSGEGMAEEGRGQSRPSGHFCLRSIQAWDSLLAHRAQSTWTFSLCPHHSTHLLHQPSLCLLSSPEVLKGSRILAGENRCLQTLPGAGSGSLLFPSMTTSIPHQVLTPGQSWVRLQATQLKKERTSPIHQAPSPLTWDWPQQSSSLLLPETTAGPCPLWSIDILSHA